MAKQSSSRQCVPRWLETVTRLLFLQQSMEAVVSWNHHPAYPKNHLPTTPVLSSPLSSPLEISSVCNRRQWMAALVATTTTTTATTMAVLLSTQPANAACLQGDLRPECIGVYKVPMDDRILPYVSTPEALRKFAPDLQWVAPIPPPQTLDMAWDLLEAQRLAANDIYHVVQQGRLEEAGIKILNLIPIVTTTCHMILEDALIQVAQSNAALRARQQQQEQELRTDNSSNSDSALMTLASNRLETQCALALGLWGETDIMVGQGIRGDLGVSAVAQLQLLTQLEEATAALDDFVALVTSVTPGRRKLSSATAFSSK
jgi:hypothetical protein